MFGIFVKTNGVGKLYYTLTDHLGSLTEVVDASNNQLVQELSYSAWGIPRESNDWNQPLSEAEVFADRGFTGHEHLPAVFGLIDMNGRMYDPVLGRFLSPDPYVQAPDYAQNFNRYAYCLNNPLIYTDPSGEFWMLAIMMGAVMNVHMQAMSGNLNSMADCFLAMGIGALGGAAGGAAGSLVSSALTGTAGFIGGAAIGAAGGAAGNFITNAGNAWAGGASFGDGLISGFKGAGFGALTGGLIGGIGGGINAHKQTQLFRKGNAELGINAKEKIPFENISDEFLEKARNVWYKEAPIESINKFTVENVSLKDQTIMDADGAFAWTKSSSIKSTGILTGKSNVYFNKNLAFTSYRTLFDTMGHELVHVSQISYLGSIGANKSILTADFIQLMEYGAYSYKGTSGFANSFDTKALIKTYPNYFKPLHYTSFPWTNNAYFTNF